MPFLAQWKGRIPAGQIYENSVISLDIFATATALADSPIDRKKKIYDGVNLMPFLTGESDAMPHEDLYWRLGPKTAYRAGDWKLLKNPARNANKEWQLYNLADDISESKNLAKENPEKLSELLTAWEKINSQMIDPVWSPRR